MFFYLRLLAAKLQEGWGLVQQFSSQRALSLLFEEKASTRGKEALAALRLHFGKASPLHTIRNRFAFHYDPAELDAALEWAPDELDLYLEERGIFNTMYYFAEALANQAILKAFGAPDDHNAASNYSNKVHELAGSFLRFGQAVLVVIANEHESLWDGPRVAVELGEVAKFSAVHIPWFVDATDDMDAAAARRRQG